MVDASGLAEDDYGTYTGQVDESATLPTCNTKAGLVRVCGKRKLDVKQGQTVVFRARVTTVPKDDHLEWLVADTTAMHYKLLGLHLAIDHHNNRPPYPACPSTSLFRD